MSYLKISADDAIRTLRNTDKEFSRLFEQGNLEVEIYRPDNVDLQQPHEKDEAYIIISGTGNFYCDGNALSFKPGDFLFVPTGAEHRFIDFTNNFATWVFFFGEKKALKSEG